MRCAAVVRRKEQILSLKEGDRAVEAPHSPYSTIHSNQPLGMSRSVSCNSGTSLQSDCWFRKWGGFLRFTARALRACQRQESGRTEKPKKAVFNSIGS